MLSTLELVAILGLLASILAATITASLRASKRVNAIEISFIQSLSKIQLDLKSYIEITNGALLARMGLEQNNFNEKMGNMFRELAEHKLYCEREFVSKETFNLVMNNQSTERKEMKVELINKMNDLQKEIKNTK